MYFSLRTKIVIITVAILLFVIGASGLLSSFFFTHEYYSAHIENAHAIGENLKAQLVRLLRLGIPIEDLVGFDEQCQEIVDRYEDIACAMVIDYGGKILFQSGHVKLKNIDDLITDPEIFPALKDIDNPTQFSSNKGEKCNHIILPVYAIHGERIASVLVGFSSLVVTRKVKRLVTYSVLVVIASFCLGIFLLITALSAWVTTPLKKFVMIIKDFHKRGHSTKKVEIESHDEIGELAAAFNKMTEELENTTVSKDYMDNIIRSMNDALIVITPVGRIMTVNNATCELLGYRKEDLINEPIEIIFGGMEPSFVKKKTKQKGVIGGPELREYETEFISRNGKRIPVLFSKSLMNDEYGHMICIVCTAKDITILKEAGKALRESQQELTIRNKIAQIFLTTTEDKIYSKVLDIVLEAMESMYGIFGYIRKDGALVAPSLTDNVWEQCQMADKDIVFPRKKWGGIWGRAMIEKRSFCENEIHSVPDGHIPIKRALAVPLIHQENVIGIIFVADKNTDYEDKDINFLETISSSIAPILYEKLEKEREERERKRAENELFLTKARLEYLLISTPAVIYSSDVQGKPVASYISENVFQEFGYKPDEFLDDKEFWISRIHPDDISKMLAHMNEVLKNGHHPIQYRMLHKDGKYRWVLDEARLINDAEGDPSEIVGYIIDITDHKHLEEQLLHAQKMEAVGRLAGGIAHDFNNLLQTITGLSECLLYSPEQKDAYKNNIKEILKAGKSAATLTGQLLAFSRRQIIQPKILDLNSVVIELKKMLRRLIGEDIKLITVLGSNLKYVKVDKGQIEQVIVNLVINARDAMPEGGKLIIKAENATLDEEYSSRITESRPGDFVCLSVEDSGIGMDRGIIDQIFEPFFSTKGMGKGTGLGLSMAYGIIKQHEGWINVYSEPGQGSTFKVYIPVISQKPEKEQDDEKVVSLERFQGKGERILLVEDEPGVRKFSAKVLRKYGYVVYDASCAKEAQKIFEQEQGNFHLILSDVVLTDTNGLILVEEFHNQNPDLKVVLCSGYSDPKSQLSNIQEKGFLFLMKPFSVANLLKTLVDTLSQEKKIKN